MIGAFSHLLMHGKSRYGTGLDELHTHLDLASYRGQERIFRLYDVALCDFDTPVAVDH